MGVNYYSPTRASRSTRPGRASSSPGSPTPRTAELSDLHSHRRGLRRDRAARPLPGVDAGGGVRQADLHHRERRARSRRRRAAALPRHAPGRDRDAPSRTARTCAASITGRWWTTSSGPTAWSLRFGLFELDPTTQVRTPRTSAAVYSRMARANGVPVSLLEKVAPGYEWLEARWQFQVPRFQLPVCPFHPSYAILRAVGPVAQLAEQRPFKPRVLGSIPNGLTTLAGRQCFCTGGLPF